MIGLLSWIIEQFTASWWFGAASGVKEIFPTPLQFTPADMQPISCSSEGIIISTPRSNLEEDDQARNREASEMQRIFGAENASHHTSLSPPVLRHPQGNSFQKFWNRQIVATVLHNECQDHFGTNLLIFLCFRNYESNNLFISCHSLLLFLSWSISVVCQLSNALS